MEIWSRGRACVAWESDLPETLAKRTCRRVPNKVLQSRNPDPKFVQSRNPEGYIWHPTSRAYFQYRNSPRFCFQIPNPELQLTETSGPEKPIWDPHVAVSLFASLFLLFPRNAWYSGYACDFCQVKIVPRFFFSLVSSYALEIEKIGEGSF